MKLPTFSQNTNTNVNTTTKTDPHSHPSTSTRSSHKRTSSSSSSTTSSSTHTFRRKSTSHSTRTSFSRHSVSVGHRRRSPEHRRQNQDQYPLAIRPCLAGVYTPSLPPELWAEILRFAGAAVDPDVDAECVGVGVGPLSSSSSSNPSSLSPTTAAAASSSSASSPPTPTSFLTYQQPHCHFSARLERYNSALKFKAGLTRVCRLFHWLAQEVLYEHVWIGKRKEGRTLAGRVCGDGGVLASASGSAWGGGEWGVCSVVSSGSGKGKSKGKKDGKLKGKKRFFGRLTGRKVAKDALSPQTPVTTTVPKTRARTTSSSSASSVSPLNINVGHFIRRLHIETPSLDKCSPHDLLIILQYSTRLQEFFDYRSVQRPMHPLTLSASDVVPFPSFTTISSPSSLILSSSASTSTSSATPLHSDYHRQHRLLTPDALLHTLFSRPLKRLSWTNYDHHPMDVVRGVKYYEDVVGPRLVLDGVGKGLEFLEISMSCSEVLFGSGGGVAWVEQGLGLRVEGGFASQPSMGVNSMLLTKMTESYRTTTSFSSLFPPLPPSPSSPLSSASSTSTSTSPAPSPSLDRHTYTLLLPSLLSLKVTLDKATFTALAKWDMPRLTHLSVMSADFGYGVEGFRMFFEVHGWKILQLELGHSSEDIEEAWVTSRPSRGHAHTHTHTHNQLNGLFGQHQQPQTTTTTTNQNQTDGSFSIPLDEWCPALHTFICSADAEWNWQSPDWIAPHVLLPTHAGLEVIGVRDMERRLRGDAKDAANRRRADTSRGGELEEREDDEDEDDPYFMLFEQFSSLLRKEAFPSLRYIRDMSQESDVIRRSGSIDLNPSSVSTNVNTSISMLTKPHKLSSQAALRVAKMRDRELARREQQGRRVMTFWAGVLKECAKRGVGLLDWRGEEVVLRL